MSFKCLLNLITDRRHVCRSLTSIIKRNMLTCNFILFSRHLVLNVITSKLYTTSLLSSLNSRQGWGYDTSENNDGEFDLSSLRFASLSQSTVEGTSVVITTPTVSHLSFFFSLHRDEIYLPSGVLFQENELGLQNWDEVNGNSGTDLEANVMHGQQAL